LRIAIACKGPPAILRRMHSLPLFELQHSLAVTAAVLLIACSSDNGAGAGVVDPGSGGAASSGSVAASGSSSGNGTLGTSGTGSPSSGASATAGTGSGTRAESGSSGTLGGTGASGATGGSGDGGANSGTATLLDAGASDSSGAPTFTQVYAIMSSTTALCSSCHSMAGKPNTGFVNAKLDLSTQALAYTNLLGPPTSAACKTKGKMYVVPGNSAMSALYAAIAGAPLCGEKMPKTPGKLTMPEIALIKAWIDGGALND